MTTPPAIRLLRGGGSEQGTVTVYYKNTGETDITAPLLTVSGNALLKLPEDASFGGTSVQVLGINSQGPAGILAPGAEGSFKLVVKPNFTGQGTIHLNVSSLPQNQPMQWDAYLDSIRPANLDSASWAQIKANLLQQLGTTTTDYQNALAQDATALDLLEARTNNIATLFAMEYNQATHNGDLVHAVDIGVLGRDRSFQWDITAVRQQDGDVIVTDAGLQHYFIQKAGGSYQSVDGTTLAENSGAFTLRQADGTQIAFNLDGRFDNVTYSNGKHLQASYADNRLSQISYDNGDSQSFHYNSQGRLAQVTDQAGKATVYAYDSSGEKLVSVTAPDGTVTHYDGASAFTYHYIGVNEVEVTDASGAMTSHLWLNERGQIAQVEDARGNVSQLHYDDSGNVVDSGSTVRQNFPEMVSISSKANTLLAPMTTQSGDDAAVLFNEAINTLATSSLVANQSTPRYEYYKAGDLLNISGDVSAPGVQAVKDAIISQIKSYVTDGIETPREMKLLVKSIETTITVNIFDYLTPEEQLKLKIDNAEDLTEKLLHAVALSAAAIAISPWALAIAVATPAITSLVFSAFKTGVDWWFDLGNPVVLSFFDKDGTLKSGMYFPDGIDGFGTTSGEEVAVRAFLDADNHRIYPFESYTGGKLVIDYKDGFGTKSTFTIYKGDFIPQLLELTKTNIATFLQAGGSTNLNAHAFVNGQDFFFFHEGRELLKIPVLINGATDIRYVSNIYYKQVLDNDFNLLLGTGGESCNDLIMGNTDYPTNILGSANNDVLLGGNQSDTLDGSGGSDVLLGNGGSDTFIVRSGDGTIIDGGAGTDLLYLSFIDNNVTVDLPAHTARVDNFFIDDVYTVYSIENITTGGGDDKITGTGSDNVIITGGGDDTLIGGGGDDRLYGGSGYDKYYLQGDGTIIDSDGKGAVFYGNGIQLTGGSRKQGEKQFISSDGTVVYQQAADGTVFVATTTGTISISAPIVQDTKSADGLTTYSGFPGMGIILITHNDPPPPTDPDEKYGYDGQDGPDGPNDPDGPAPPSPGDPDSLYGYDGPDGPDGRDDDDGPFPPPPGGPGGGGGGGTEGDIPTPAPKDPNDIAGPLGFGNEHWTGGKPSLPYSIRFENQASASGPAQEVTITQTLDSDLDARSFRLGDFGWGDITIRVPNNSSFYTDRIDLTAAKGYYVDVIAGIDVAKGQIFWTLTTIDPKTGDLPQNPTIGFLPPNDANKYSCKINIIFRSNFWNNMN